MRKVIGITIAVFMLAGSLVGCGNSDTEKSKTATVTSIETQAETEEIVGKIYGVINKIAQEKGFKQSGYRVIVNCGKDAGQEVQTEIIRQTQTQIQQRIQQ